MNAAVKLVLCVSNACLKTRYGCLKQSSYIDVELHSRPDDRLYSLYNSTIFEGSFLFDYRGKEHSNPLL